MVSRIVQMNAIFFFLLCTSCTMQNGISVSPSMILLQNNEPATVENITIKVENTGNTKIQKLIIQPDCGCYTIASATLPIHPGEDRILTIPFEYPKESGSFHTNYFIVASYPNETKRYPLEFSGKTKSTAMLHPELLSGVITRNHGVYFNTFVIESLDDSEWDAWKIESIQFPSLANPSDVIDVQLNSVNENKILAGTLQIKNMGKADGQIIGKVSVHAKKNGRKYRFSIPIQITFETSVTINPNQFFHNQTNDIIASITMPSNTELIRITSKKRDIVIPFKKESSFSNHTATYTVINFPVDNLETMDTIEFHFSNGKKIMRYVLLNT